MSKRVAKSVSVSPSSLLFPHDIEATWQCMSVWELGQPFPNACNLAPILSLLPPFPTPFSLSSSTLSPSPLPPLSLPPFPPLLQWQWAPQNSTFEGLHVWKQAYDG